MRVNQSNIATFYIAITIAGSLARAWMHIIVQMYLPAGMSCMYVMYEYYAYYDRSRFSWFDEKSQDTQQGEAGLQDLFTTFYLVFDVYSHVCISFHALYIY